MEDAKRVHTGRLAADATSGELGIWTPGHFRVSLANPSLSDESPPVSPADHPMNG